MSLPGIAAALWCCGWMLLLLGSITAPQRIVRLLLSCTGCVLLHFGDVNGLGEALALDE